jgi:hypothetical protein
MPLVTVTAKAEYFPAATPEDDTERQALTAKFGADLPDIMKACGEQLGLGDKTPKEAVQVDYQLYHPRVVNGVDLWVCVLFTEEPPSEERQLEIRKVFITIMRTFLAAHAKECPSVAVDIFWGPGRGFFLMNTQTVLLEW